MNHWARNLFEKILQVTIRLSAGFLVFVGSVCWVFVGLSVGCLLGVFVGCFLGVFVGSFCWGCLLGVLGCLLGVFTDCPHCSTNPRPHFLPFSPY